MSDDDGHRQAVSNRGDEQPAEAASLESVEAYEVDEGVVLYDAENPLAWVRADSAVRLDEQA